MKSFLTKKIITIAMSFSLILPTFVLVSCKNNQSNNGIIGDNENNNNNNNNGDDNNQNNNGNNKPVIPNSDSQFSPEYNKSHGFAYPTISNNKVSIDFQHSVPTKPGNGVDSNAELVNSILPNNKYLEQAKQTYAVTFWNGGPSKGTAWILDYELTNDGSYPLKWFFGTNAHVIDNLRVENDKLYPERFGKWFFHSNPDMPEYEDYMFAVNNTERVQLITFRDNHMINEPYDRFEANETTIELKKDKPENGETLNVFGQWENMFDKTNKVKTIFIANDFLHSSPKDYSDSLRWSSMEEYADFGVFEINFENQEQAKKATNNYYNLPENKKFNYLKTDYLKNKELKTDNYYIVGFPDVGEQMGNSRNVFINMSKKELENQKRIGGKLGTSEYYSTFVNNNGVMDGAIGLPWFGYNYEYVNSENKGDFEYYNSWGLMYSFDNSSLGAGASGSLARDENGVSLGVYFAADPTASTGIIQAFYSNGYNYNGYYGKYNIPEYDLIRGGKKDQKNSYYDGLVGWYGKNSSFKTRLFPNGLTSRF